MLHVRAFFLGTPRRGGANMLHLVKPVEGDGLDILLSATAVPIDDERLRLAAVLRYEILDTAPEAACDRITALAADLFNVPISIIGFVDRDRIWFKSHHGIEATEIQRDVAGSAVLPSISTAVSRMSASSPHRRRR